MTPLTEVEVRTRLAARLSPRDLHGHVSTLGAGGYDLQAGREFLEAVLDDGFGVAGWPTEFGGRAADPDEITLIEGVLEEFAVPDIYPYRVGLRMVGPTLLEHGTPEQQQRWLRAIATGEQIWCQMFSEPEAGSDLANVATAAVPDGTDWALTGQKVWTSRAAYADWGMCLARTDPQVPKHDGLTMFAVPMAEPGVDVRPLVQMNGDAHFSEVFLSGVRVPDGNRIGEVGRGWSVAMTLLTHERTAAARSAPRAVADQPLPAWLADLADNGALCNPVTRDRAMALYVYEQVVRFTELRGVVLDARPGPNGSGLKLHGARSFKQRMDLLVDAQGARGMLADWTGYVDFLTAPSMSIRGGTDEVQRNVIAERVLGLPKDPSVDRTVPWTEQRRRTGRA